MKQAAVFDIDGTISDDRWRKWMLDPARTHSGKPDYESYHIVSSMDQLINKHLVEAHIDKHHSIVFATGRPERYRRITQQWLQHWLPGVAYELLMRGDRDHRPSPTLKLDVLKLLSAEFNVTVVYDDRQDVVDALSAAGFSCVLVRTLHGPISEAESQVPMGKAPRELLDHPSASEILAKGAETFAARNRVYGDNYKTFGAVMAAMMPNGFNAQTVHDWNKLGVFVQIVSKLTRFANSGLQHTDSVHDLMVYAAMMEELTNERNHL